MELAIQTLYRGRRPAERFAEALDEMVVLLLMLCGYTSVYYTLTVLYFLQNSSYNYEQKVFNVAIIFFNFVLKSSFFKGNFTIVQVLKIKIRFSLQIYIIYYFIHWLVQTISKIQCLIFKHYSLNERHCNPYVN